MKENDMKNDAMIGAIVVDVAGSRFEWLRI